MNLYLMRKQLEFQKMPPYRDYGTESCLLLQKHRRLYHFSKRLHDCQIEYIPNHSTIKLRLIAPISALGTAVS